MKNIIPFKKDVIFKTNISEVVSISLEHNLTINDDIIKGEFIVTGDYKISDKSLSVDPFNLNLPFEIVIDEKYDTTKATLDIDDFYYEIVNDNVLRVAIDVLIDRLEEKTLIEEIELVDETPKRDIIEELEEERCLEKDYEEEVEEIIPKERCLDKEELSSVFNNVSSVDTYATYNVYIVREGDNIESIIDKYNTTLEELEKYNDLSELKLGDKLIIPKSYERD